MVQINYAKLNEKMQRYATGTCEGGLEGFSETDLSALVKNNKPPEFISFDGNGIDLNDRNKKFYESGDYAGYISSEVSDENCNLSGAEIYISYKGVVLDNLDLSQGITFSFYGDCCREMYIQYINSNTETFWEENIAVNSDLFVLKPADTLVSSATALRITFTKTTLPNQFLKLSYVKFGTVTALKRIKNINLLEEINVLSDDLPINSLEYTVVLDEPIEFQDDDLMGVYSNGKYYGTFYLDEAERIANNIYSIRASNCIRILDDVQYPNYDFIEAPIDHFLNDKDQICELSKVPIEADEDLSSLLVYGHIPIESCRFAVCALGFAGCFMVDGSRNDRVVLKRLPDTVSSVIKTADKRIIGQCTFTKSKPISKAILYYPQLQNSEEITIEDTAPADMGHYVVFPDPPTAVTAIAGNYNVYSQSLNHILFKSKNDSAVITAVKHILVKRYVEVSILDVTKTNEVKFDGFNIIGYSDGIDLNSKLADIEKYIQSGGTAKAKIRLRGERVGDLIQIETAFDGMKTGIITSMDISFGYEDVADIEVLEWNL